MWAVLASSASTCECHVKRMIHADSMINGDTLLYACCLHASLWKFWVWPRLSLVFLLIFFIVCQHTACYDLFAISAHLTHITQFRDVQNTIIAPQLQQRSESKGIVNHSKSCIRLSHEWRLNLTDCSNWLKWLKLKSSILSNHSQVTLTHSHIHCKPWHSTRPCTCQVSSVHRFQLTTNCFGFIHHRQAVNALVLRLVWSPITYLCKQRFFIHFDLFDVCFGLKCGHSLCVATDFYSNRCFLLSLSLNLFVSMSILFLCLLFVLGTRGKQTNGMGTGEWTYIPLKFY